MTSEWDEFEWSKRAIHVSAKKIVLDLDETLVCAYETSSLPIMLRDQATEPGLKWFEMECISSDKVCLQSFFLL